MPAAILDLPHLRVVKEKKHCFPIPRNRIRSPDECLSRRQDINAGQPHTGKCCRADRPNKPPFLDLCHLLIRPLLLIECMSTSLDFRMGFYCAIDPSRCLSASALMNWTPRAASYCLNLSSRFSCHVISAHGLAVVIFISSRFIGWQKNTGGCIDIL